MDHIRGKTFDQLEVIDWEDASMQCGGDERDDAFLVELLITYYEDGLPRIKKLLEATLAYRAGHATLESAGGRTIETVIKEEAHALKGSAANVRLWRLAKAAEDTELPCKGLIQNNAPPGERRAALDAFCLSPCTEIGQLVQQFKDFVGFMERDARALVLPGVDLEGALDDALLDTLALMTAANVEHELAPYAAFYGAPAPAAAAAAPLVSEGSLGGSAGSSSTIDERAVPASAGQPSESSDAAAGTAPLAGASSPGRRGGSRSPTSLRGVCGTGSARVAPDPEEGDAVAIGDASAVGTAGDGLAALTLEEGHGGGAPPAS